MPGIAILFTLPAEFTRVNLGMKLSGDFIELAAVLEEYVQTTYAISCAICRTSRTRSGYLMMRLAVSSTCPMEALQQIARGMSTRLTYLNVTINGRLITVSVFANVEMFAPQDKPIVTGCEQVYLLAGLAFSVHECPSVLLSFAEMKYAGITNAKFSNLTFSGCIGIKSNDPNMLNISFFGNLQDKCPQSDYQTNSSRVYTVCIDSYLRLRSSTSSSKWVDMICFSITEFIMLMLGLFIRICMLSC
ncbi:hypothetical protein DPMN_082099 [Dreissena polymorpha]|uniref:Uncharacterized protein n=1 Tax=Dreissena polymorpha TaxID=45954 RepID=A0A9D4BH55_DREPO|nr:hypothetical protein DPMN_082099 [Dreissena polymorpha]